MLILAIAITVLLLIGMPVAFAILIPSIVYFLSTDIPHIIYIQRLVSGVESFPLLAIPLFVLAGSIMQHGGIAERIMRMAVVCVGHFFAGLAHVVVLSGTFLGAISGSAFADTAILAKTISPQMIKEGYPAGFSAVLAAASALLAPLLPPSIMLILYGVLAEVSIGRLFMAGVGPGILVAVFLIVGNIITSKAHNFIVVKHPKPSATSVFKAFKEGFWALMFPVIIWVGLRMGVFTPTELGAFVCLYCFIIGKYIYKDLKWADVPKILRDSAGLSSVIMFMLIAGGVLNYAITWEQLPQAVASGLLNFTDNKYLALLLINSLVLVLGLLLEAPALVIILAPILVPVAQALGVDLVHFGIILTFNLILGSLTPPIAPVMFIACSVVGCSSKEFLRYFWIPFSFLLISLVLITYFPSISLALPNYMFD